jgi:hypothetical protein
MPQKDGESCTQKIANCLDEIVERQPGRLDFESDAFGNEWYICNECAPGYYWDDMENYCKTCGIDNCHICESIFECSECMDGYF